MLVASVAAAEESLKRFVCIVLVEVIEGAGVFPGGPSTHCARWKRRVCRQRAQRLDVFRERAEHTCGGVRTVTCDTLLMRVEPAADGW